MARILVVGSVNIDRVWWLNAPLRDGARISYDHIETRYGGGGYYTGQSLLSQGHEVRLLTRLADDEAGQQCRAMLAQAGFDISLVAMIPDETRPFDILVDPSGERTILFAGQVLRPPIAEISASGADLVYYLNVQRMDPAASDGLLARHSVISPISAGRGGAPAGACPARLTLRCESGRTSRSLCSGGAPRWPESTRAGADGRRCARACCRRR